MKFYFRILLVIMLLMSALIYVVLHNPSIISIAKVAFQDPKLGASFLHQKITNKSVNNCPNGTSNALKKADLVPTIPLSCRPNGFFDISGANIVDVFYDQNKRESWRKIKVPMLELDRGDLYILPHRFTDLSNLTSEVSSQTEAPFSGSWSNFKIDKFSEISVFKKKESYCLQYNFKFPFTGTIYQCPHFDTLQKGKRSTAYKVEGKVAYQNGAFKWKDALKAALEECPKYYNSQCKFNLSSNRRNNPYHYWSSAHAQSLIVVNSSTHQKIEYYLFAVGIYYDRGTESTIFVQAFPDGKVRSKEVDRNKYHANIDKGQQLLAFGKSHKND